jgi:hypothetical protein
MELSEDQYRLIEAYIDGTLEPAEGEAFLALKESSAAFRDELNRQVAVIATLKAEARAQLKAQLKKDLQGVRVQQGAEGDGAVAEEGGGAVGNEVTVPKIKRRRLGVWFGLAASIVVLIGLVVFLTQWRKPASHEAVFAAYYHPYPAPPQVRHAGSPAELEAMGQYREQHFAAAIPLFQEGLLADSGNSLLHLYLGNAYLAIDSLDQARRNFGIVLGAVDSAYSAHAEWYFALADLKDGDLEAAKLRLGGIVDSGSPYGRQAEEVLIALGD